MGGKKKVDSKKCSAVSIWATCEDCGQPIKTAQAGKRRWDLQGCCGHGVYVNVHRRCPPNQSRYKSLLECMVGVARENGYVLNPDKARVEKVLRLMAENLVAIGKPYCPCKQSDPLNPKKDVICPCPAWKKEIAKDGHCFCRLFYRKAGAGQTGGSLRETPKKQKQARKGE